MKQHANRKLAKAAHFDVDVRHGLTDSQVEARLNEGLVNKTKKKVTKSYGRIIFDNLFNFLNIILFCVFVIMVAAGLSISHYVFMVILCCNIIIGLYQDIHARLLVDKLRVTVNPKTTVIRSGRSMMLDSSEIVLSDIIELHAGDAVPADSQIVDGDISVDESLLTGESVPVPKKRGDMIFASTYLTKGVCHAKVKRVGAANYVESIQASAKQFNRPKSEIKKSINILMTVCGILAIAFGIMTVCAYAIPLLNSGVPFSEIFFNRSESFMKFVESFSGSIVAMLPAGMFLLTSLSLAVGVVALARKRILVQQLYCIEMLARIDVLCLDKTGTLTDGTMAVVGTSQMNADSAAEMAVAISSVLHYTHDSNATANALRASYGSDCKESMVYCIPFDSELKYSAVTLSNGKTYVFGAYGFVPIKSNEKIGAFIESKAREGYRCLVVAKSKKPIEKGRAPKWCDPIGIVYLSDHIKPDAKHNIEWFKGNGVSVKIISGDDPVTVSEIAKRVGVDHAERYVSLEGKSVDETAKLAGSYSVFGRVSPEQKAVLIDSFKKQGHKVAMTGDGVNDILALKVADCSIAMASGSDAAKNVSHLVALDSDFSRLPDVVAQGRRVINNLQRTCSLFLSKTFFAVLLTFLFSFINIYGGPRYPFSTSNLIIWEIITIGIAAFFLALQPSNERLRGSFMLNVLAKAFPSGLCEVLIALIPYMLAMINPGLFVSSPGDAESILELTKTLSVVMFTLFSYIVLVWVCLPINAYRGVVFGGAMALGAGVLAFDFFAAKGKLLGINWQGFNYGFIVTLIVSMIIVGAIYFALNYLLRAISPKEYDFEFEREEKKK